jgi:hypothetical protein
VTTDQFDIDRAATMYVRRYRRLAEVIADAQEEQKTLQARFRALVPTGYALDVDGKAASKTAPARSFDLAAALEVARAYGIPAREVLVVDTADLKARLTAAGRIDEAMLPGKGAEIVRLG